MARNCVFLRRVPCLRPPSWGTVKPSNNVLHTLVEGHQFYGLAGLLPSGYAKVPGHRTPNLEKTSINFPSPPQKKGSSGKCDMCSSPAMQVVKKQFLLHANSGAIINNFRTYNFRRLSPYVFFEFSGAKKLELQIFLTSDKMAFCRACAPLSRCGAASEQLC